MVWLVVDIECIHNVVSTMLYCCETPNIATPSCMHVTPIELCMVKPVVTVLAIFRDMAESALKNVEDQLNCSMCVDIFTDPRLTPKLA